LQASGRRLPDFGFNYLSSDAAPFYL